MLEIKFQTNLSGWHSFLNRRRDANFQKLETDILKRDLGICSYCGFQADRLQQVVNIDNNYANNKADNLGTACLLCCQCQFLGSIKFGVLIYLPEFSQIELNHLVRSLFCAMHSNNKYSDIAKTQFYSLRNRAKEVDLLFGEGISDSLTFGQTIIDAGLDKHKNFNQVMKNLRLLPYNKPLSKTIDYWATLLKSKWNN